MSTIKKIAKIGYAGLETVSFPGVTAEEAGKIFKNLDLQVCGAHSVLPAGDDKNEVLDTMAAIDCKRIVHSLRPADSVDKIKSLCNVVNHACEIAANNGMTIMLHNHWWEFEQVEGRLPFDLISQWIDSRVLFEIDPYWIKVANCEPIQVIKSLGPKMSMLHINDGSGSKDEPMVPVGSGKMDVSGIIMAARQSLEWLIVDLSMLVVDEIKAVKESYHYLINNGLADDRNFVGSD